MEVHVQAPQNIRYMEVWEDLIGMDEVMMAIIVHAK